MMHSGGFTFRQQTPKHLKQLLPTTPATHSYRKLVQPEFPEFSRYLHTWLGLFLLPLWLCWKGLWFPARKFPPATSLWQAGKGVSFCQILSGECIWGECLPCSPPPSPLLWGAPGLPTPDLACWIDMKGPCVTSGFPAAEIIPAEPTAMQCPGETAIPDRYHLLSSDTMSAVLFAYLSDW